MNTEYIVYIARKLHWPRAEIGQLTPIQLIEILKELHYQESVEEYNRAYSVALLLAAISNTIPRKRGAVPAKATDFLSMEMPTRSTKVKTDLEKLALAKGIKLPKQ